MSALYDIKCWAPRAAPSPVAARAAKLYPDSPYLQVEWIRAVRMVRATSRGWLMERPMRRQVQP